MDVIGGRNDHTFIVESLTWLLGVAVSLPPLFSCLELESSESESDCESSLASSPSDFDSEAVLILEPEDVRRRG